MLEEAMAPSARLHGSTTLRPPPKLGAALGSKRMSLRKRERVPAMPQTKVDAVSVPACNQIRAFPGRRRGIACGPPACVPCGQVAEYLATRTDVSRLAVAQSRYLAGAWRRLDERERKGFQRDRNS